MATRAPTASPGQALEKLLQYGRSGISTVFAINTAVISAVTRPLVIFKLALLPVVLYLLSPITVLIGTVVDVFFRWPYKFGLYLLVTSRPVYAFWGVACIMGVLIGLTGRTISIGLLHMLDERPAEKAKSSAGKGKAKA